MTEEKKIECPMCRHRFIPISISDVTDLQEIMTGLEQIEEQSQSINTDAYLLRLDLRKKLKGDDE